MNNTIQEDMSTDTRVRENREILQQLLGDIAPKVEARLRRERLSDPTYPAVTDDDEALSADDDRTRITEIIREVISGYLDEIVLRGRDPKCETAKMAISAGT